jgi:hypothetical protein
MGGVDACPLSRDRVEITFRSASQRTGPCPASRGQVPAYLVACYAAAAYV